MHLEPKKQLVERSKRDVPAWTEMEAQQIVQGENNLRFHLARKGMRDLPLAVKQSQLQATSQFRHQLIEAAAEPYQRRINESEPNAELLQAFNSRLEDLGRQEIFDQIQVEDMYYETLAGQGPIASDISTTHNVHVLVRFSSESFEVVKSLLREKLLESDHAQLKELVQ